MTFCSLVMISVLSNAEAGRCAPRPLRARPRLTLQPNDTVCLIKFDYCTSRAPTSVTPVAVLWYGQTRVRLPTVSRSCSAARTAAEGADGTCLRNHTPFELTFQQTSLHAHRASRYEPGLI